MSKYFLKPEFIDNQIITRTTDGTEILVTKNDFNDYFAELFIMNGQEHLVKLNPNYEVSTSEKKTFEQITEGVILLTSNPLLSEEKELLVIANEPELKRKRGRQPKKLD